MSDEVIRLNQILLNAIASGNFAVYNELCANDLTCFEAETKGSVVQGKSFHKFFFDLDAALASPPQKKVPTKVINMAGTHVRCIGDDVVVLSYTRLDQSVDGDNGLVIKTASETRVWERRDGNWVHVHFHKS